MDIRILSVPFLGVTMMGAVTGAMIPCSLALHLNYCSRQTGLQEVCGCRMGGHHLRGQSELRHPNSLLRLTGTKVAGF